MPVRFNPSDNERGAALLTVLLLVAVMSVIAATALDRLQLATKLAGNGSAMAQARAYSYAIEDIAASRIEDLLSRSASQLTAQGGWLEQDIPVPIEGGISTARISDASNCFNVNSLVVDDEGELSANPVTINQFRSLMLLLGISDYDAYGISEAAGDWIDSDTTPLAGGAEDSYYRGLEAPYLPANRMMADASELLAVKGMKPEIYDRISGYVCALPIAGPTVLNVNTLSPERAALFSMLFGDKLPVTRAKAYLANRPAGGYGSLVRFWNAPLLAALEPLPATKAQVSLTSEWFQLRSSISVGDISLQGDALISAQQGRTSVLSRSWGVGG